MHGNIPASHDVRIKTADKKREKSESEMFEEATANTRCSE